MNLDFIPTWASAIAQFEGSAPGTPAARNHNPGNLKFAGQPGAIGRDSAGFAIFPDDGTGYQALTNQLAKYVRDYPNDSILDITAHYLGQSSPTVNAQGDAFTYAAFVAGNLGVPISTTLGQLAAGPQLPDLNQPAADVIPWLESGVSTEATAANTGGAASTPFGDTIAMLFVIGLGTWLLTRSGG